METARLPANADATAPDGSQVRLLVAGAGGSMAHFSLDARETSVAVAHRTIEELWYFVGGEDEMWRRTDDGDREEYVTVVAGTALSIPPGTAFQFRATGSEPLRAVGVTMPPWPGYGDLEGRGEVDLVVGPWTPTVVSSFDRHERRPDPRNHR